MGYYGVKVKRQVVNLVIFLCLFLFFLEGIDEFLKRFAGLGV